MEVDVVVLGAIFIFVVVMIMIEPYLFVIVLMILMVGSVATPLTTEIKTTPLSNGCERVVVTSWKGFFTHIDSELCEDGDSVSFLGKTFKKNESHKISEEGAQ